MSNFEFLQDIVKKNWIALISIAFGIVSIAGSVLYVAYFKDCPVCEEQENAVCLKDDSTLNKEEIVFATVKVDVKGAVKTPGVYELKNGSTIQDAIKIAGGITSKGTTTNVNLSKKLTDEMVIYIFTKDEIKKAEANNQLVCEVPKCECETITVNECIDKTNGSNQQTEKPTNSSDTENKLVSINTATLEELSTLDGIGQSKAKAINEYRSQNGLFKSIEEIKNVSGIGDALFEKIKEKITT